MISIYDYLSIAFYFIFVVTVGILFRGGTKTRRTIFAAAASCRGGWRASRRGWRVSARGRSPARRGKSTPRAFMCSASVLFVARAAAVLVFLHLLPVPPDARRDAAGGDPHPLRRRHAAVRHLDSAAVPAAVRWRGLEHRRRVHVRGVRSELAAAGREVAIARLRWYPDSPASAAAHFGVRCRRSSSSWG